MAQQQLNPQTPPKGPCTTIPIVSIAKHSNPSQQPLKQPISSSLLEPYSFGASSYEKEGTQRKIKLVSGLPPSLPMQFQRTQKKKFIKLLSALVKREREEGQGQEQSVIADEHTPEESHEEQGEGGASLNYFQQQLGRMGHELRGITEEHIEEEGRMVLLSNKVSHQQINVKQPPQNIHIDQNPLRPKRKIILSKQSKPTRPQTEIKPVFRYCIGCQQPILEANTLLHQSQCESFQRVFKMDYREITELLGKMVGGLTQRIDAMQQALTPRDLQNLKLSLEELLRQSVRVGEGEERRSFGRSVSAVERESRKWVSLAEQVCRLNWFITLRSAIQRQSSLPPAPTQ